MMSSGDDQQDEAVWAPVSRGRAPFQHPAWYRAAGWLGQPPRLRLLRGRSDRAVVPVWLTREAEHYYHHPAPLLTGHRERAFVGDLDVRLENALPALAGPAVLSVSPYGYCGGALHADLPPGPPGQDELGVLARAMIEHAQRSGARLALSHYLFDEDDGPWLAALAVAGCIPVVLGAHAVLDVTWDSLAHYRRWLTGSRRYAFSLGEPGVSWQVTELGGNTDDGIASLLYQHAARFDAESPPPRRLFSGLVAGLGPPGLLFTAAPQPGRPRSALLALRSGDVLYAKFFGTTEPRADYFPLVFTRLIGYAIEHGIRRIEYGGGSHQAKLLRGARLRPALGMLWAADESARVALRVLCEVISARKLAHFGALARRWQMPGLPLAEPYSSLDAPLRPDLEVRYALC